MRMVSKANAALAHKEKGKVAAAVSDRHRNEDELSVTPRTY